MAYYHCNIYRAENERYANHHKGKYRMFQEEGNVLTFLKAAEERLKGKSMKKNCRQKAGIENLILGIEYKCTEEGRYEHIQPHGIGHNVAMFKRIKRNMQNLGQGQQEGRIATKGFHA
jgi:hypothetical protein